MMVHDPIDKLLPENIYGHTKRLRWMISHLQKPDLVIEFGCGTGYMITVPLLKLGYNIFGLDCDAPSIALGQEILALAGFDHDRLAQRDLAELEPAPDVIIASEVFEHIPSGALEAVLKLIHRKLKPGGRLLVTVPNGYGWFELECFIWYKMKLGKLFGWLHLVGVITILKKFFTGRDPDLPYVSTLAQSPHVQRFTSRTISKLLEEHGFEMVEFAGSVGFAGPFSNLFFSGFYPVMKFNNLLGRRLGKFAASFYLCCRVIK